MMDAKSPDHGLKLSVSSDSTENHQLCSNLLSAHAFSEINIFYRHLSEFNDLLFKIIFLVE